MGRSVGYSPRFSPDFALNSGSSVPPYPVFIHVSQSVDTVGITAGIDKSYSVNSCHTICDSSIIQDSYRIRDCGVSVPAQAGGTITQAQDGSVASGYVIARIGSYRPGGEGSGSDERVTGAKLALPPSLPKPIPQFRKKIESCFSKKYRTYFSSSLRGIVSLSHNDRADARPSYRLSAQGKGQNGDALHESVFLPLALHQTAEFRIRLGSDKGSVQSGAGPQQ